jgi:hypothetical protein
MACDLPPAPYLLFSFGIPEFGDGDIIYKRWFDSDAEVSVQTSLGLPTPQRPTGISGLEASCWGDGHRFHTAHHPQSHGPRKRLILMKLESSEVKFIDIDIKPLSRSIIFQIRFHTITGR